jgi:rare lipoprotein A
MATATWYGRQHQGRRTSSGERFDMNRLTAAHGTLPLGTRVKVTNLDNGKEVEVRINDRHGGRPKLIDLSDAAARVVGMRQEGLTRVMILVVAAVSDAVSVPGPPPPKAAVPLPRHKPVPTARTNNSTPGAT